MKDGYFNFNSVLKSAIGNIIANCWQSGVSLGRLHGLLNPQKMCSLLYCRQLEPKGI